METEELRKQIEELEAKNKELTARKDQFYDYWMKSDERCKTLENALASVALTANILKDSLVQKP